MDNLFNILLICQDSWCLYFDWFTESRYTLIKAAQPGGVLQNIIATISSHPLLLAKHATWHLEPFPPLHPMLRNLLSPGLGLRCPSVAATSTSRAHPASPAALSAGLQRSGHPGTRRPVPSFANQSAHGLVGISVHLQHQQWCRHWRWRRFVQLRTRGQR